MNTKFLHWVEAQGFHFLLCVRDLLDENPEIDQQLKIYSLDEFTIDKLEKSELNYNQWSRVIESISEKKPKQIIIFGDIFQSPQTIGLERLLTALYKGPAIYASAFTDISMIDKHLTRLSLHDQMYEIPSYIRKNMGLYQWLDFSYSGRAYGPSIKVRKYLNGVGFVNHNSPLSPGIEPFKIIDGRRMLPHLSMLSAENVELHKSYVLINGSKASIDSRGLIHANMLSWQDLNKHTTSIVSFLSGSQKRIKANKVKIGDTVVLFANQRDKYGQFTDATVQQLHLVSAINSVLSGRWIKTYIYENYIIFLLLAILIWIHSYIFRYTQFITFSVLLNIISCVVSGYLFVFHLYKVNFMSLLLFVDLGILVAFIRKRIFLYKYETELDSQLKTSVPADALKVIKKNPLDILNLPIECHASLLFITFSDIFQIEGAQNRYDKVEIFKNFIAMVQKKAHKYGGIVEDVTGENLRLVFAPILNHKGDQIDFRAKAMLTAIDIQSAIDSQGFCNYKLLRPTIILDTYQILLCMPGYPGKYSIRILGYAFSTLEEFARRADFDSILMSERFHKQIENKSWNCCTFYKHIISSMHATENLDLGFDIIYECHLTLRSEPEKLFVENEIKELSN